MGLLDKFKGILGKTAHKLKQSVELAKLEQSETNEIIEVKRDILSHLSTEKMKTLAHLLEVDVGEKEFDPEKMQWVYVKERGKKSKFDYLEAIANCSYKEIIPRLRHLHESSLADELEMRIREIEQKYGKRKGALLKGIPLYEDNLQEQDTVLTAIMNKLCDEIASINPEKYHKEREFQIGLKEALKVAVKKDFPKSATRVEMEYEMNGNRRLDILVQIDQYKIGVETKYNLSSSGHFQRAVGQVLEYSRLGLDGLIIVQYEKIEDEIGLNNLNELSRKMEIPF